MTTFKIIPDTTQNVNLKVLSTSNTAKINIVGFGGPIGNTGAQGIQGPTGPSGLLAANSPLSYDSVTKTISLGAIDGGTL
jgi:hypothetical protein